MLKRTEGEVLGYTYLVQSSTRVEEELSAITRLNHAVRNVSYAAKFIKDIRHNLMEFRQTNKLPVQGLYEKLTIEVITIYKHILRNLQNKNPELAVDHYIELRNYTRQSYEKLVQDIYADSGEDRINDMETSSLLNVNRSFYLSNMAILESLSVLLAIPEEQSDIIQA